METKKCTHCNEELSINFFHKNRGNKDGYSNHCKACTKLKPFPIPKRKICEICKIEKPINWFFNEASGKYSRFCHSCIPKLSLASYYKRSSENPERFKEYHRLYKQLYRFKNKSKQL